MNSKEINYALFSNKVLIDGTLQAAVVIIEQEKFQQILSLDEFEQAGLDIELLDFADKTILPGLVDTHVHINQPGRTEWEGFNTATQAAAAGGITTVVDMPLNCSPVTTTADALQQKLDSLQGQLWIDCGFWGGVTPHNLNELDELIQAGVLGVKSFTIHSGIDEFPQSHPEHLSQAIRTLAKYNIPYLIHAELEPKNSEEIEIGDKYQSFLASRPKSWENDAIDMMISLAQEAKGVGSNGKIHIVHLSSADAIDAIKTAQQQGLQITAESCPHYLTLFSESIPDGKTVFKCCPPIREDANRHLLWQGLADGIIEFIVSDHSPCTPQLKHIDSGDIEHAWGGISSLQFGLSIIWSEAKERGYSLEQVIDWMATRPATFAGLGDKKGQIKAGFDADFIIFDADANYTITTEMIKYRHKITPYEGRKVLGVVEQTFVRGQQVFSQGEILGAPIGQTILADYT
ncbi:MAG: allantoinase AllB [Colwellia sp.]|nr:allantoinase AllB [Colwellia sp.]